MDDAEMSPTAVAEQLERVLKSDVFRAAGRSSKLLRFLVEETINGRADHLKDYTLGAEALGRGDSFDPRTDPIARVEASRLRSRLDLYYATEGASDPVLITLPKGGYVPRFDVRSSGAPIGMPPGLQPRRGWIVLALAAVLAVFAATALWWRGATATGPFAEIRLELTTPATTDPVSLAISPDGEHVVFVASAGGQPRLWLRPLKTTTARVLTGTEQASLPFWSPDAKSVGFFADSKVKRIDIASGRVDELAGAPVPGGGTWNHDGLIVYAATTDSPLESVSSEGVRRGTITVLAPGQTGHRAPQFLPDGRHFVYYAMGTPDVRGVHVGELGGGISRRLFDADTPAMYAANHLFYVHQGTLMAQRFSPSRLEFEGDPAPIAEHVTSGTRATIAALATAANGLIAYRTGSPGGKRELIWFDRNGREVGRIGSPHGFGPSYASMSPDGRRLAVQRTAAGNTDIWLLDVERDTPVRFTTDPEADIAPLWSPGGDRIVFSSRRNRFNLYEKPIGGAAATELLATEVAKSATDWSNDGRFIMFRSLGAGSGWDIWALPMNGERKPLAVVQTKFEERDAQFSPDGKWIAYQSDESGRFEIYLQRFPVGNERIRISPSGGAQAQWRADGRELFYLALNGQLLAVPIAWTASGVPVAGTPVSLFSTRLGSLRDIALHSYVVSPDGQRFLLDTLVEEPASPIVLILNWEPPS
jgi:Tol biopolymer transport system component